MTYKIFLEAVRCWRDHALTLLSSRPGGSGAPQARLERGGPLQPRPIPRGCAGMRGVTWNHRLEQKRITTIPTRR